MEAIMKLVGIFNPLNTDACFSIPIFESNGCYYTQTLGDTNLITGFSPCSLPKELLVDVDTIKVAIGGHGIFSFYFSPSEIICGSNEKLREILAGRASEFQSRPFLTYEIAGFLNDDIARAKAGRRCAALLGGEQANANTEEEQKFLNMLEHLPEDINSYDKTPEAVSFAIDSGISLRWAVKQMKKRLSREKREQLDLELPLNSRNEVDGLTTEKHRQLKDNIIKDVDTLRKRLVDMLCGLPIIWRTCQEEIAGIEPISDISIVFRDWRKQDGLGVLVTRLAGCSSYETLRRYNHPLIEIKTLADQIEEAEPDVDVIEQSIWVLLHADGKPGAKNISRRLTKSLRNTFSELAWLLEEFSDKHADLWATPIRRRLFRTVERLVAHLPGEYMNINFQVQDFCWRAVLLDKAGEFELSFSHAARALDLAGSNKSITNEFMWWSRLADANRIAAKHSGDPMHLGWEQGIEYYKTALTGADENRKTMIYRRMAEVHTDWLATFGAYPTEKISVKMGHIAYEGRKNAKKASKYADYNSTASLFIEARLQALLVQALRICKPERVAEEEHAFEAVINAIFKQSPRHVGVIWLVWSFYREKGEEDYAIRWLDRQVMRLRETEPQDNRNLRVADYFECQAVRHLLNLGRQNEARERLYRMVTVTQPNNAVARRELFNIGLYPSQEQIAQQLYKEARDQLIGSPERKNSAFKALEKNQTLIDADPEQNDVVPWTRHARLFLLMDEINKAMGILERLKDKYPRDPYIFFHLGEAYYREGQKNEISDPNHAPKNFIQATAAFEKAWGIVQRVDTAHRLAACWSRRENTGKALNFLREAERIDHKDGWTKLSLGWVHYQNDETEQAFQYWTEALQCLTAESDENQRTTVLAKQAANAIVRFAELSFAEVPLERLNFSSLYMLVTAACSTGWHRTMITITMAERMAVLPLGIQRKIPHALRAHLLYLQLAEGEDVAYQWHKHWFEKLNDISDPKLFFEYAAGAKGAFRRAISWSLSQDSCGVLNLPKVVLDEARWGKFLNIASTWGPQDNYYTDAYATWPEHVNCDELWAVVCRLNSVLFRKALEEVGLDGGALSEAIFSSALASAIIIESEIIPARELNPESPKSCFIQTDELSARILLK
jgi:tetratricopeptide (TPR) repeat protein